MKLGFNDMWIFRVMTYVTTASYSVKVNGTLDPKIVPSNGLCQEDPLSLYFYLICTKGLSCLLNEAKRCSNFKGVKVARCSPSITHIFFIDDSLIFYRANTIDWLIVQSLLDRYEKASGRGINKHKYGLFFSSNTLEVTRCQILNLAEVPICNSQEKYLGLPMLVGNSKYRTSEVLKDRVWSRISNWKNTFIY